METLTTSEIFEARIAREVHAEAKRLGVNPHALVRGIAAYVTLPPTVHPDPLGPPPEGERHHD